ncbi:hypothetical protein B0H13DRAFT_2648855 [Mycena leptocephala]|nr:hypothetical protein B0H13DRAFT_2648855 [Mycena leptocephala]
MGSSDIEIDKPSEDLVAANPEAAKTFLVSSPARDRQMEKNKKQREKGALAKLQRAADINDAEGTPKAKMEEDLPLTGAPGYLESLALCKIWIWSGSPLTLFGALNLMTPLPYFPHPSALLRTEPHVALSILRILRHRSVTASGLSIAIGRGVMVITGEDNPPEAVLERRQSTLVSHSGVLALLAGLAPDAPDAPAQKHFPDKLTDHHHLVLDCVFRPPILHKKLSDPTSATLWPPTLLEKLTDRHLDCVFRPPTLRDKFSGPTQSCPYPDLSPNYYPPPSTDPA